MMNDVEQQEREAESDGYRNEYQRAMAWSQMQPHQDDRVYALTLVQEGRFVAVEFYPRHCKITDAIIGEHCSIIRTAASRKELEDALSDYRPDSDVRIEIWPQKPVSPPVSSNDNNIPF